MRGELIGPVCHCGKPFRRRRVWYRCDGGICSKCGAMMECLSGTSSGRLAWMINGGDRSLHLKEKPKGDNDAQG